MDKDRIRERVWDDLEESGEARFPFPPHGRIPNFAGADDAAARLRATDEWAAADVVKANPDAPQLPVRRAALRDGKTCYVAVPRLRDERAFRRLDPAIDDYDDATTVGGIEEYGTPVGPAGMSSVDLIVSGSVAVNGAGVRIGKGEGYSDLEFAVLRAFDLVDDGTTTVTTVHDRQVIGGDLPTAAHDVPMDLVVTPSRTVRTDTGAKPTGVDWDALPSERVAEMPLLERLRPE